MQPVVNPYIDLFYTIQIVIGSVVIYDYAPSFFRAVKHAASNWTALRDMCADRFFLLSLGIVLSWAVTTAFAVLSKYIRYEVAQGAVYYELLQLGAIPFMLAVNCLSAVCHLQASQRRVSAYPILGFGVIAALAEQIIRLA